MCIICVVGDLDWSNVGFETIATDAMKNIPVRMISYGGSTLRFRPHEAQEDEEPVDG